MATLVQGGVMSGEHVRLIPKAQDDNILRFFEELQNEMNFGEIFFSTIGTNQEFSKSASGGIYDEIKTDRRHVLRQARANLDQSGNNICQIRLHRGVRKEDNKTEPSLFVDHLYFEGNRQLPPVVALKIDRLIENIFGSEVPAMPASEGVGFSDLVATHHQLISDLSRQNILIAENFTKSRIAMEEEYNKYKREVEKSLESEKIKLNNTHEKNLEIVTEKQKELAARESDLDDRDNTHVRRSIRVDLKRQLADYKNAFSVSDGTRKLRWPVTACVIAIEVICVIGAAYFARDVLYEKNSSEWIYYLLWAKSAGLTFVAVGTAMWYLRWLTSWSQRHADAEFRLRQLELDIERASWVVETAFEWKHSQQSSMPEPLLHAITRNLFVEESKSPEGVDSPADHLASALLGNAARVELDANGHKISFDRKGVAALKKATDPS